MAEVPGEARNTPRGVVPVRLSDRERAQIAGAAGRRKQPLSSFVREAALAASAVVQGKVSPRPPVVPEPAPVVVVDANPVVHYVDGVPVGSDLRELRA